MTTYPGYTDPTGTAPSSNLSAVSGAYEPFTKKGQVVASDIDSEGATDGHALTADGSDAATWESTA